MTPVFIYICFGRVDDYNQALYSILSLIKYSSYFSSPDHHLIIYTDSPGFFEKYLKTQKYKIEFSYLDPETLHRLKGGEKLQQVFRVKLALIQQTLRQYQRNVMYLDADTYIIKDLAPELQISKYQSGMCADEGHVIHKKNNSNDLEIFHKYHQYFTDINSFKMYNAGLILIHFDNKALIHNALKLLDEIFPVHKYYFLEQFLVSYQLSKNSNVKTFEKYIRHYWYQKEFTQYILEYNKKLPFDVVEKNLIPEMQLDAVPGEKIYKSFIYQWPLKIKKRLKKWGIYP